MTPLVPLTMFGWIPLVLLFFRRLPPHRAALAAVLLAWMFLPQYNYELPGLPNYSKISAASYGVLLATALFNRAAFGRLRLHRYDLPMLLWCLSSLFSSLANGLGLWDGLSAFLGKATLWGIPYFIGRLYFDRAEHLRDLCLGLFLAALLYAPFCLYEVAMSPRLHRIVYGWHPHLFGQTKRGGGWRPQVFMAHGLMNAMWMGSGALAGLLLHASGQLRRRLSRLRLPALPAVLGLIVTFLLCKSMGSILLITAGLAAIVLATRLRRTWLLLVIMLYPLFYMTARGSGLWNAETMLTVTRRYASDERFGSLEFRVNNETLLAGKARERPLFGWAGWKRSWVRNDAGETITVPDGLWIIAFGQNGIVGLGALAAALLLPQALFLRRYPVRTWRDPPVAALVPLAVLIGLFMLDNLLNDMFNPAMLLAAGGINGLALRGADAAESGATAPSAPPRPTPPRLL